MKGMMYTIAAVLIMIPIISLVICSSQNIKTGAAERIRTNEMTYFLQSIEKDSERFLEISSRRTLAEIVENIASSGKFFQDPESFIIDAIEDGKCGNETISLLENENFQIWKSKVQKISDSTGFDFEIKNHSFSFKGNSLEISFFTNISDKNENIWIERNVKRSSEMNIEGLEDPIFIVNTYGRISRKIQFADCKADKMITGSNAKGYVSGIVLSSNNWNVISSTENKNKKILLTDSIAGNEAIAEQFAGVVTKDSSAEILSHYISNANSISIESGMKVFLDENTKSIWNLEKTLNCIKNGYYQIGSGPDFLSRIKGSLENDKGFESIVNLNELSNAGIPVKTDQTCIDYLYFDSRSHPGKPLRASSYDPIFSWFRIDEENAVYFNLNELLG